MLTSAMEAWDRDVSELVQDLDWDAIWDYVTDPNHQVYTFEIWS